MEYNSSRTNEPRTTMLWWCVRELENALQDVVKYWKRILDDPSIAQWRLGEDVLGSAPDRLRQKGEAYLMGLEHMLAVDEETSYSTVTEANHLLGIVAEVEQWRGMFEGDDLPILLDSAFWPKSVISGLVQSIEIELGKSTEFMDNEEEDYCGDCMNCETMNGSCLNDGKGIFDLEMEREAVIEEDAAKERKKVWHALGSLDARLYELERDIAPYDDNFRRLQEQLFELTQTVKGLSRVSCSKDLCGNE